MARPTRTITRDVIEITQRIAAVNEQLVAAMAELIDAQPGYPTSSGGGSAPQLSADGKPAGLDRYLLVVDPAVDDLNAIDRAVATARDQVAIIHRLVGKWSVTERLATEASPSAGADCVACGTYCPGGTTRLRAGLCNACRMAYRRWTERGGSDRGEWMLERRRDALAAEV